MTHKIKRLAILFLGLWLVTAGLREQLAEAAAGRKSPGYSKPSSSPTNNVWGSRSGGGSYGYSKPAAPSSRRLYQAGHQPDRPRRLYQTGGPWPRWLYQAGGPRFRWLYQDRPPARPVPAPPPTPNRMESSLRQLRGGMPNRGKARLRQLIPPRPPGPRTPKPARPSAPSSTRSWSKGCKGRELPSP